MPMIYNEHLGIATFYQNNEINVAKSLL